MTMPDIPDWHVEADGIHEETELPPHGTALRVVKVIPYVIDSGPAQGTHGVVRVTPDQYTPDSVSAAIDGAAQQTHNIAGLNRSSV